MHYVLVAESSVQVNLSVYLDQRNTKHQLMVLINHSCNCIFICQVCVLPFLSGAVLTHAHAG